MVLPRNLLLVYLVVVSTYTAEGFLNIVLAPYLQSQGVPVGQIGALIAGMAVASLCSRIPAGLLYRPGRANLYIAGASLVVAAVTFAYPRTDAEPLLFALRLLHGFAFGVCTTLNMAQFFDARPAAFERGRAMGLFAACLASGYVIGSFVGGWWADTFGFEAAFTVAAIFPLVAAAINLQIRVPAAAAAAPRPRTAAASGGQSTLRLSLAALRNPGILLAALLLFCVNLLNQMHGPFFTLYALEVGFSLTVIGTITSVAGVAAMFARLFAGELRRWWSYAAISRGGLTLAAALVFLVPTTALLGPLAALTLAIYVLRSILTVTGGVSVIDATETPAEQRGVAAGLFNMGKDLGSIAGPLLGGLVAEYVGVGPTMQVIPVVTLIVFWGGTALLEPRLRRARARAALASAPPGDAAAVKAVPRG